MSVGIDQAGPVREGEQLDAAKLEGYVQETFGVDGPIEIAQFRSGHSNLTYLLRIASQEYVLRRPPFGSNVKSAHDMGREFAVLSRLHRNYAPAPRPLAYCQDETVIGAPFYLMERIQGVILRVEPPASIDVTPELARACSESFVENLVALHRIDFEAIGLNSLRRPGQYIERQVSGWAKRYGGSKTDDIPEMDAAIRWLEKHTPPDSGASLIHNDYKYDNIVFDPADLTRIVGVLDWEMATIGDPLADLGASLAYWIDPGEDAPLGVTTCFMTRARGAMTRRELVERYFEITGREAVHMQFYYVLGLFKLAVIVQQIYYRFAHGLTKDERFAILISLVKSLAGRIHRAIESDSL